MDVLLTPPPPLSHTGDIFLSKAIGSTTDTTNSIKAGQYGSRVINLEIGHALGLKFVFTDNVYLLTKPINGNDAFTSPLDTKYIVPFFSVTAGRFIENYSYAYADNFTVFDIASLQAMYGADLSTRTENNTYYFDPAGTVSTTVHKEGAFYYNLPLYHTIWDAGGENTLDFSTTTNPNVIRLNSGSYSDINYQNVESQILAQQQKYRTELGSNSFDTYSIGSYIESIFSKNSKSIYTGEKAVGIAYGAIIENATGGQSNDQFYDNAVNNILIGNAGDDTFYLGAGGFDTVQGGSGEDRIVLNVTRNSVQMEKQQTGATLLVADTFAVTLTGIESIQFSDQLYSLT